MGAVFFVTEIIVDLTFKKGWIRYQFHLHLSTLIINIHPCYIRQNLNHAMTRLLIATAFTAVALWNCIHCVPADTSDIRNF